jgi:hypothetical protein
MDWQRTGAYEEANHNPGGILNGKATKGIIRQTVTPGTTIHLSGDGTRDPNGDALQYRWWQYYEADGFKGKGPDGGPAVSIANAASRNAKFTAPLVNASTDIHVVLEVTDDGSPHLTGYRRIVVTVEPQGSGCVRDGSMK